MNLKEGRIGKQEGILAALISAVMLGLMAFDGNAIEQFGANLFIVLPLAILGAFVVFQIVGGAMAVSGQKSMYSFLKYAIGSIPAQLVSLLICLFLLICALETLRGAADNVHLYAMPKADYEMLVLYCTLPTVFLAWNGLECIGRSSKVFAGALAISLILCIAFAAPDFEIHRIYPSIGDTRKLGTSIFNLAAAFLPALLAILTLSNGLQGVNRARRYGAIVSLSAALVLLVTYVAISMAFSYNVLSEMSSPLYRLGALFTGAKYSIRFDSVFVFAWLIGSMIAASFYVYSAAFLFANAFKQGDVRLAIVAFSVTLVTALVCLEPLFKGSSNEAILTYGAITLFASAIIPSFIASIKAARKKGEPYNA